MAQIGQWPTHEPLNMMRATLRSVEGVRSVLLCTGNPGGPGHQAAKARWIDPAPNGYKVLTDPTTGLTRVFIPARLEDNPALTEADPTYEQRLLAVGNAQLVKAWRWGEWDLTFGGYFDDIWTPSRHVLKPFRIPPGWTYRRSFDWGSAKPFSLGMFAVSPGAVVEDRYFPKGSLIRFSELYGVAKNADGTVRPNEGLRLNNIALGERIANVSRGRSWSGCVADPSIFTEMGSESIYAQLQKGSAQAGFPVVFGRANNDRLTGWQRMRDMLEAATHDRPESAGLWVFENCVDFLRTVPTLQRDERQPDDVDTDQEDHCLHGDTLVETPSGSAPIRALVGTCGLIRSIDGWRPYYDCRMTRRNAEVINVEVEDGRSFVCTPDHRVLTPDGWIEAGNLLGAAIVDVGADRTPRTVTAITSAGTVDVFNLEVEGTHCFAVSGGLIVHNCADESRYACLTGMRVMREARLSGWS
jgi:hypothetical protein